MCGLGANEEILRRRSDSLIYVHVYMPDCQQSSRSEGIGYTEIFAQSSFIPGLVNQQNIVVAKMAFADL